MASEGSVTRWIDQLKAGDPLAAQKLWERYFRRLVGLARRKLHGARPQAADEEDIALSAFDSFCRSVDAGRFPRLDNRDNLWCLLAVITARKVWHLRRDEARQKRGGKVVSLADTPLVRDDDSELASLLSREPTPEFAAELTESYRLLLDRLGDPQLEAIAVRKMEGYTNEEISTELGCAPRTVERKLRIIRSRWQQESMA